MKKMKNKAQTISLTMSLSLFPPLSLSQDIFDLQYTMYLNIYVLSTNERLNVTMEMF